MELPVEKINKLKVKPLPTDKKQVVCKGSKILPVPYSITFFAAKTNSGKTTAIVNLIPKIIGPETKCFLFVSTAGWDPAYAYLKDWFDEKEIDYEVFEDIVSEEEDEETGRKYKVNNLADILKDMSKAGRPAPNPDEEPQPGKKCPRYLFLLDDMSDQLKNTAVKKLFKQGRQYEAITLCSSQDVIDIGRLVNQLRYICIWGGQPAERLEYIHKHMGVRIPFSVFMQLYEQITAEPYQFMFMSRTGEVRRNFDEQINVPEFAAKARAQQFIESARIIPA
ncbi:MAG: hypothetical protein ACYC3F_16655 [Gemmatimonadaceae bacterium]